MAQQHLLQTIVVLSLLVSLLANRAGEFRSPPSHSFGGNNSVNATISATNTANASRIANTGLEPSGKDCPSIMSRTTCNANGYARTWVKFYIEIGGWIMLSVIVIGSLVLITTQFFSKKYHYGNKEFHRRIQLIELSTKHNLMNV